MTHSRHIEELQRVFHSAADTLHATQCCAQQYNIMVYESIILQTATLPLKASISINVVVIIVIIVVGNRVTNGVIV